MHGFFKGMLYPLMSAGAMNSLFFGVYGFALKMTSDGSSTNDKPSLARIYFAGCAGGFAQLTVACPVDLVKIKLQTQTSKEIREFPSDEMTSIRFLFFR